MFGSLAVEIFNQVGREAAIAQYNLICEIAQRRYEDSLAKYGSVPAGFTALNFLHPAELQERYIWGWEFNFVSMSSMKRGTGFSSLPGKKKGRINR